MKKQNKKDIVYILKKVERDMTSNEGTFKYPKRGWVEAKDWKKTKGCGNGLHGLAWGCGDFDIDVYGKLFMVLKVNKKDGYVDLGDKVKFKRGYVVLVTESAIEAINFLKKKNPDKNARYNYDYYDGRTIEQGYRSTSNQGDESTSKQGDESTSKQGYRSTSKQGNRSTSKQGDESTSRQGDGSTSTIYGEDFIYRNDGMLSAIIMFWADRMRIFQHGEDYETGETIRIVDMKIVDRYKCTPNKIEILKDHEIFVFGSNLVGDHAGGAAELALENFGAQEGKGEGLYGQSYAFPTLSKKMKKRNKDELTKSVDKLIKCATAYDNTKKIFLVTKVGCGIAGYKEEEMIELFDREDIPANIVLPKGWGE